MTPSFEHPVSPDFVEADHAPYNLQTSGRRAENSRQPAPLHIVTPLLDTEINGRKVGLKLENLQPARSFKLRGIGKLCQHHADRGVQHFVCSSAGNAGYAVAWAGRALDVPVTVFVPGNTPEHVRRRIASLGARVNVVGDVWDHANAAAMELARAPGCAFIPPFDHPMLWQGHASLIDELVIQCEHAPEAILLAVGGGGLLLGVLEGLARVGWRDTRVFAVEPERASSLGPSLQMGRVVELARPNSVASSLCVKRIAPSLVAACAGRSVTALTVSDDEATHACVRLAQDHGQVVEPACGAALAPLYADHPALAGLRSMVAIVCGGMVVTLEQLAQWSRAGMD
jgi:L-serine/L-threonine ammonia-lyase